MYVTYGLQNGWADFDEIFRESSEYSGGWHCEVWFLIFGLRAEGRGKIQFSYCTTNDIYIYLFFLLFFILFYFFWKPLSCFSKRDIKLLNRLCSSEDIYKKPMLIMIQYQNFKTFEMLHSKIRVFGLFTKYLHHSITKLLFTIFSWALKDDVHT